MTHWIALSRSEHANARWQPRDGFHFAADQQIVEILLAELARLLPHYTIAFVRNEQGYQAVALLGVGGERNLYVNRQGKWLGAYVPAALRGYPFTLANSAETGQKVFCIDAAYLDDGTGGVPAFDDEGNLTEKTAETLDFLKECEQSRQLTRIATEVLDEAGLIEAWPLKIERSEGQEPLTIGGLYRINETHLNELENGVFAGLRKHGALLLAYSQLLSMAQIDTLRQRAEYFGKEAGAQRIPEEFGELFDDNGTLNFDHLK